jgi:hypothetical protein
LSALATDNHCVLTYKESGPAKGNRIEVISNVRSPSQNADLVSSIGLTDHVYIEIMYEPDKRDVALAHATSVIQTIRLKSGTPQTPQQAPLASQSAAWKSYENADFSISYPAIWRVSTENRKFSATDPSDERRSVSIEWRPGVENKSGILNQCASIDELLTWFYKTNYEQLDSGRRQYPFTSVTHDDFQPGRLGGRSTNVSIVYQAAYQLPVTRLVNVQVVPRAGGAYIVTDSHPSEPNHEPFRLSVFNSIVFKAGALDGKAYCNYLGQ